MSLLELHTRERDWARARAHDRKFWPTPAAWARALLQLAGPAMIRARAQARLWGGDTNRELFALMTWVERIADERFVVVRSGDAIRVWGPRQLDDPRPAVISRAAGLAGINQRSRRGRATAGSRPDLVDLLAEADQQEKVLRRSRRSNLRGLELAERYMAGLPRPKPQAWPAPPPRPAQPRTARSTLMPCGSGEFVFVGVETEPLQIDIGPLLDRPGPSRTSPAELRPEALDEWFEDMPEKREQPQGAP